MTAVIFKFVHPDGTPVANAPFTVSLRKASFDENLSVGITLPGDVPGLTDALGMCTLELLPGFGIYYLTMQLAGTDTGSDGCSAGLRYRFQVPDSAVPIRVEDVIVTTPTWSRPWDETALQIIIDAKGASQAAAIAAALSESHAKVSETAAAASAMGADASEAQAGVYAQQAAASKDASAVSAAAAEVARLAAQSFREQSQAYSLAAGQSAAEALASKNSAAAYDGFCALYAASALDYRNQAEAFKNTAGTSATNAATSATNASNSAAAALVSKDAAALSATNANTAKVAAEAARDIAVNAAGSLVGVITDRGNINLSGGAYPAAPTTSSMWKVTVGGMVGGVDYGVGDTLMYTLSTNSFYKIDNTENISSVNGRTGAITLTAIDVGLNQVNNTSDANKPVSTAQATAIGLKVAIADIVNGLASTAADKPLSAAQGKVLNDGLTNRYTKAEANAEINKTYASGTFITGLLVTFGSGSSIYVTTGAAWVPGAGLINFTGASYGNGMILNAQAIHYVYLYSNAGVGAIEWSLTGPSVYDGTAYFKTGDSTRRLIGMYHTSGGVIANFTMTEDEYLLASSSVPAPWSMVLSGAATAATNISLTAVVPPNATVLSLSTTFVASDGTTLSLGNSPFASTAEAIFNAVGITNTTAVNIWRFPVKSQRSLYYAVSAGYCFIRLTGYKFER